MAYIAMAKSKLFKSVFFQRYFVSASLRRPLGSSFEVLAKSDNIFSLGLTCFEHRIPFDGITHFLPRLYPCRGFAPLSGQVIILCT